MGSFIPINVNYRGFQYFAPTMLKGMKITDFNGPIRTVGLNSSLATVNILK